MKLQERFLKYVMMNTQSLEGIGKVPSTPGQKDFSQALVEELNCFVIEDVRLDYIGYIYCIIK